MFTSEASEESASPAERAAPAAPSPTAGGKRILWLVLLTLPIVAFLLTLWLSSSAASRRAPQPLAIIGEVPAFSLTERDGRTVSLDDLRGSVWVANFIFTRCAGPCPELTLRMGSLQRALRGIAPAQDHAGVKLVSFTLDPQYDTPKVLTAYADRSHADPRRWLFLTGPDQTAIHKLIREGFLQTVMPANGGDPIIHSTYFVLIDRNGYIRGYYDGLDAASKPHILQDVERLLSEPKSL